MYTPKKGWPKSIHIKQGWYPHLSAGAGVWLDENLKGDWNFSGNGVGIYVSFEYEEDKCVFILKYGDYIA